MGASKPSNTSGAFLKNVIWFYGANEWHQEPEQQTTSTQLHRMGGCTAQKHVIKDPAWKSPLVNQMPCHITLYRQLKESPLHCGNKEKKVSSALEDTSLLPVQSIILVSNTSQQCSDSVQDSVMSDPAAFKACWSLPSRSLSYQITCSPHKGAYCLKRREGNSVLQHLRNP